MSLKDAIRAATVGAAKNFKTEIVEVNGHSIEVRQISIGERNKLSDASRAEAGSESNRPFGLRVVTQMCYEPGTNERLFDDTDIESMLGFETGSWVDTLIDRCLSLLNVTVETAAKNSEATPTAS